VDTLFRGGFDDFIDALDEALDVDSEVSQVNMVSSIDELERRLEVLLGAQPLVPVDASEQRAREQEAERLRREQVAEAGGRLIAAAFDFLSHLLPDTSALDNLAALMLRVVGAQTQAGAQQYRWCMEPR
jgi:hypothetical protein